jgi:lipoprotein-releasing system permease protein
VRYALGIGFRYLLSKKTKSVSVITAIAVSGVALGVAALLSVMAITAGFQDEFRDKVLGVNAHVLIMKYGDFEEYRDVVARALEMPEVAGAGPFLIKPMMLAHGDRISGVLVKGIDPELMPDVLDLPDQMVEGSLEGLRVAGAVPPLRPEERERSGGGVEDLDAYLRRVDVAWRAGETTPVAAPRSAPEAPSFPPAAREDASDDVPLVLPDVSVPTPEQAEAALAALSGEATVEVPSRETLEPSTPTAELPGLVVGRSLATELDIEIGDRVRVVSPLAGFSPALLGPSPPGAPRAPHPAIPSPPMPARAG